MLLQALHVKYVLQSVSLSNDNCMNCERERHQKSSMHQIVIIIISASFTKEYYDSLLE